MVSVMPLGDPGGGRFEYTVEGLPEKLFMATIPSKDLKKAVPFYTDVLGMELLYENDREAAVKRGDAILLLKISDITGIDTGIFIGVDNPYDLHRRLVDEGVVFVRDPIRVPLGVYTSFRDDEGNILHAIEMKAELKP